jgi:hypothetical protein
MKKRFFIFALALAFSIMLFPLISASSVTDINVKTLPNKAIYLSVIENTDTYSLIPGEEIKSMFSGSKGIVRYVFIPSEWTGTKIRVMVVVKNDDKSTLYSVKEGPFDVGSPVNITILPADWVEPVEEVVVNVSEVAVEEVVEGIAEVDANASESNLSITGFVSSVKEFGYLKITYWSLGIGFVFVAMISLMFVRGRKKADRETGGKMEKRKFDDRDGTEKKLEEIEREIAETEKEINAIKSRQRVANEEKVLAEKMRELEELKRSQSDVESADGRMLK